MKVVLILGLFALISCAQSATSEPSIDEAVKLCEREVPRFCVLTTCPLYCNGIRSTNQKNICKAACTNTKRCSVKANVASNTPGNEALDAQNREQLIRCIAQTRDPNFTKTGMTAEDIPWKQFQTPTFKKAIRP